MKNINHKSGFTLIELLVVIFIIALISTIATIALSSARQKGRDAKRVADIRQVMTALDLYNESAGDFPASITAGVAIAHGSDVYMVAAPTAPLPADGTCTTSQNTYTYVYGSDTTYTVTYCLGGITGQLAAGVHTATPAGVK